MYTYKAHTGAAVLSAAKTLVTTMTAKQPAEHQDGIGKVLLARKMLYYKDGFNLFNDLFQSQAPPQN